MSSLKICIVSSLLEGRATPDEREGTPLDGTGRIAHELATHLVKDNHEVVAVTDGPQEKVRLLRRAYDIRTVGSRFSVSNVREFAQMVSELRPQIVHFHGGELLSYYALLSKMINHIPTVFTFTFIPSLYRRAYRWPIRCGLSVVSMSRVPKIVRASKLDHVIALTEHARRRLVSDELIPNTKLSLIRYGLTQTYLEQSHSLDHRLSESIFCVSGVTSARGLDTFMSVVPYVKSRFPEARFFVGVRNDEEERRARLALRHGVELLRPKSLLEALNANSVVVLPFSKHMAVDPPLSMIESMAMGKPVISTRIGSIPETLGRDRGILVERDDPAGLGEAICRFLRDPELGNFFGDNAREYIVKTYNWTTALTNLLDVYRRLASDPVHLC